MSSRYTSRDGLELFQASWLEFIILNRNYIICFILAVNYFYLFRGMFNYLFTHSIHRYERCIYVSQESNMPLATRSFFFWVLSVYFLCFLMRRTLDLFICTLDLF